MTLPPLLRFFLWKNFTPFYLLQFLSSFFRYSQSNFPLSYPYNIFAVNLPSISLCSSFILLPSFPYSFSYSSTASFAFFRFVSFSHKSSSAVYSFYLIKYSYLLYLLLLFIIFSTSYSSSPSIITGRASCFFCPQTCSLYLLILLTFTTGWILTVFGNSSSTALVDMTLFTL